MSAELPLLAAALAIVQLLDAAACAVPIPYLAREFDRLGLSARTRQVIPPIKVASAIGLLVGLWRPLLGAATAVALVAYFLVAVGAHVRVSDPPMKFAAAVSMGIWTAATLAFSYLPAI